jgi:hypothetical protein
MTKNIRARTITSFFHERSLIVSLTAQRHQRDEAMDFPNHICTKSISLANYIDLTCEGPATTLPDGSQMCCNESGTIIFMHYASGVKLRRHHDYVICLNQFGEHWIGDSRTAWFRLN